MAPRALWARGDTLMLEHSDIYGAPKLYDLAFSYRDFVQEAQLLQRIYAKRHGHPPASFLELAAGPARHALALQQDGLSVCALDLSPAMADYARQVASELGLDLPYLVADMTDFALDARYDVAACMLCSATYLLTQDAWHRHLRCVRGALNEGGLYVLELPHPSEVRSSKTRSTWNITDARGELTVLWDRVDSSAGVASFAVQLLYQPHDAGPPQLVTDQGRQRDVTLEELCAHATESGFILTDVFGALDERVPLDDPKAWRMLAVLERVD